MLTIKRLVFHHSGSPRSTTFESIREYHMRPMSQGGKGYVDIGYHFVVFGDGTYRIGRPIWKEGAHSPGHNRDSIGICIVGDNTIAAEAWIPEQIATGQRLIDAWRIVVPGIDFCGHCDIRATVCPAIDVKTIFT